MTDTATQTRSVVIERDIAHPPEKIWRALTQPHLIAEWLMQNDFVARPGHVFTLRSQPYGDWNGIIDCKVLAVEPHRTLTYSWDSGNGPLRVTTIVTWTLTPSAAGTHLKMEQSGFRPDQPQNIQGAQYGWQQFLGKLETLLAKAGP